jgi:hypothetical protein
LLSLALDGPCFALNNEIPRLALGITIAVTPDGEAARVRLARASSIAVTRSGLIGLALPAMNLPQRTNGHV